MATVYDDNDNDEVKFRRWDTGYNTTGLSIHSPLRSVRVASETSNVSVAELEQTLAAVNKRISELSAVRDSTFARWNLQSVFNRTHGQDGDRRHVLRTVSESDRHSMSVPLDSGTLSAPAAIPLDRRLKAIAKVDRHSTALLSPQEYRTMEGLYGGLPNSVPAMRPEVGGSLASTQHLTGILTGDTVAYRRQ